jgi:hypothetical protein
MEGNGRTQIVGLQMCNRGGIEGNNERPRSPWGPMCLVSLKRGVGMYDVSTSQPCCILFEKSLTKCSLLVYHSTIQKGMA